VLKHLHAVYKSLKSRAATSSFFFQNKILRGSRARPGCWMDRGPMHS
jgi:hypothetical protein